MSNKTTPVTPGEKNVERRFTLQTNADNMQGVELREVDGVRRVEGYAAVFNSETNIAERFAEVIAPGAFEGRLADNVVACVNHNSGQPLAKVGAGLSLSVDSRGLKYGFDVPDTTTGRDLIELMKRGIVSGSSFAFTVEAENWERRDGDLDLRTIEKVGRLIDVSAVTTGAYPEASVALRSQDDFNGDLNDSNTLMDLDPLKEDEEPSTPLETSERGENDLLRPSARAFLIRAKLNSLTSQNTKT